MNTAISKHPASREPPSGRFLALGGAALLVAPLIGLSVTALWFVREFQGLSRSMPQADPSSASRAVGHVLVPALASYGISAVGVVLILIAVLRRGFTPRWLWRALLGTSFLWLLAFPFGTVIAFAALIILYRSRHVFSERSNA